MFTASISNSGSAALQILRQTASQIETTQDRIATGLRVSSAKDDPTAWATAQSLRSENATSKAVISNLRSVASQTDLTGAALTAASETLVEMRSLLSTATTVGADRDAINKQVDALQDRLKSIVSGANVNGSNWASGTAATVSVVTSVNKAAAGNTVASMSVDLANVRLSNGTNGLLDAAGTASTTSILAFEVDGDTTATNIANMITDLDTTIANVAKGAASLASAGRLANSQADFLGKLASIRESAIGKLVNADMGEETARLEALRVREQLAITALSIANASKSVVLQLFR